MLNGMPAFMGRNPHSSHRGLIVIIIGKPHRIGTGIVMVSAARLQTFDLHIVKPLIIQDAPGGFRPRYPGAVAHFAVFAHGTVHHGAGPQTQHHADQNQNIRRIPIKHTHIVSLLSFSRHFRSCQEMQRSFKDHPSISPGCILTPSRKSCAVIRFLPSS